MSEKEEEFFQACQRGNLAQVKSLASQVDVNWSNPRSFLRTGLHIACIRGNQKVVQYLLTLPGVDVNKDDEDGKSPLLIACRPGSEEIVKMLTADMRVDVNKADRYGRTPLWWACSLQDGIGAAMMLLASNRQVDTTRKSQCGEKTTAAEIAKFGGNYPLAELVEEYERDPQQVLLHLSKKIH